MSGAQAEAALTEPAGPRDPSGSIAAAGSSHPLAYVELLDRDGGVQHRIAVTRWPLRIGRALDCDVILDDPHAAAHHATIEAPYGIPTLALGPSPNGALLGRRRLSPGDSTALLAGSEWQIGRSRLRLRLPGEALPVELPLPTTSTVRSGWLVAGVVALLIWLLAERWVQSDPGNPLTDYLPVLLGVPASLAAWCFAWALGSKLFTRHFDFLPHVRWALGMLLVITVLDAALPLLAFATSWEWLALLTTLSTLAVGCLLVYGHLRLILPARREALALGFATMFVVGVVMKLALSEQRNDRWFEPLYLSTLGPPALRLAPAASTAQFLDEARSLRTPLERRARDPAAAGASEED